MRGVMGQQNSCMILIEVHSTMHLMHPIKVQNCVYTAICTDTPRFLFRPLHTYMYMYRKWQNLSRQWCIIVDPKPQYLIAIENTCSCMTDISEFYIHYNIMYIA